jgi:hypothetical protein
MRGSNSMARWVRHNHRCSWQLREISGENLLKEHFPKVDLWKGLALEGLANRDSIPYAEKYGLGPVDGLRDLYRGTLRYASRALRKREQADSQVPRLLEIARCVQESRTDQHLRVVEQAAELARSLDGVSRCRLWRESWSTRHRAVPQRKGD